MIRQRIPGIVRIGFMDSAQLPPDIMMQSLLGIVIGIPAVTVTWVPFTGEPLLTWEGSVLNGARCEKATLKFSSDAEIPDGRRLAFVVRCASGLAYVVGAREALFPQVTYSETTGSRSGDGAVRAYTVTHLAQKSVLQCAL